jgi:phospho-N-acetylmuramoyl-pentapeptide-transferase
MKECLVVALLAFGIALVLCLLLIPLLRRLKAGQNVLSYVKEHQGKSGTPTFGGLAFLPAAAIACLPFLGKLERNFAVVCVIGLSYMGVGFLDDLLKKLHHENKGLSAWQKLSFQTVVAVLAGYYCVRSGQSRMEIPFGLGAIELGWWMLPFSVFVYLATVNAVNLTDGLDGLAAGVAVPFFLFFGVLTMGDKTGGTHFISFALVGALCAYLLFNTSRASIFMGDTGSLGLGGFASSIGLLTGKALYIPILGVMFVVSVISVIVQVIYYKATGGKRIFRMSPVHHHFQQAGFSESKIAYAYAIITAVSGVICLLIGV